MSTFAGLDELQVNPHQDLGGTDSRSATQYCQACSTAADTMDEGHGLGRRDSSPSPAQAFEDFQGLDELEAPPPDENPSSGRQYHHTSLEAVRSSEKASGPPASVVTKQRNALVLTYSSSWLIFFSILGTLARLGVTWLGTYPGMIVLSAEVWANVGGTFVLGFLQEDRALFEKRDERKRMKTTVRLRDHGGRRDVRDREGEKRKREGIPEEELLLKKELERRRLARSHLLEKQSLPIYIGLSVGFCGSFTSFSSFMRDVFLALTNSLSPVDGGSDTRNPSWSVCAVLALLAVEIGLPMIALSVGAHFAELIMPVISRLPRLAAESRHINAIGMILGIGCWIGTVLLAIWPVKEAWRGDVIFALVFAPLGCLLRFFLAIKLNPLVASFPTGTFTANMLATAILSATYSLQHSTLSGADGLIGGGYIPCQILSGIQDGLCGCLSTVSTWMVELRSLRKTHGHVYGLLSVLLGMTLTIAIMGTVAWTHGFQTPLCL